MVVQRAASRAAARAAMLVVALVEKTAWKQAEAWAGRKVEQWAVSTAGPRAVWKVGRLAV